MAKKPPQSVEEVHAIILDTAARVANGVLTGDIYSGGKKRVREAGQIFRADPIQSQIGGLCLSLDESTTHGKSQEEILELHYIGVQAIHEAITLWHPELFAGVIVGEAKKGRNYFDRFSDEKQLRFF